MTRSEYKDVLLGKRFVFNKTQNGFPSRGEEDVYTHPSYRYKFYVTRVRKGDDKLYGFYTGERNGEYLDIKVSRNVEDDFRSDKALQMWTDDAFIELMDKLIP
ncbi:hypothetical protein KBC31_03275 [Candidatus Saccharibacteria bacterium]|jgi:hypothetical protein|nr:hypothetical protein [Candidatus Saccharibacteria bacterium]